MTFLNLLGRRQTRRVSLDEMVRSEQVFHSRVDVLSTERSTIHRDGVRLTSDIKHNHASHGCEEKGRGIKVESVIGRLDSDVVDIELTSPE